MKRKGLYKLSDLYIGRITPDDGYTLAQSMLKRRRLPSAVFIANDLLVIGAMRAFHEHGVKIPHDISIVGFNDNDFSRYLMPALTTVKVHTEWMGKEAVNLLLERLNSARSIAKKVILPAELVIRESCRFFILRKQVMHMSSLKDVARKAGVSEATAPECLARTTRLVSRPPQGARLFELLTN